VRQRTRIKNQVQAIPHRNMMPRPPVSDLFGTTARRWLFGQDLSEDEHHAIGALLRQSDFIGDELATANRE
jgi:transposase